MKKVIIRQHNDYVSAPYAIEVTTHEIKLFEYMIADSKIFDRQLIINNQNKQFQFTATELSKLLNTSLSRIVADGDKLAENITRKRIVEKKLDADGNIEDFLYIPIITFAQYRKGLFTFAFNSYILKYFIDINENFTEYQLHYLLSMRSAYAIKLYKLLYQYLNIKNRTFTIEDLKEQFGVKNKYRQYNDFKKYVVIPSVEQINKITDLIVNFTEIKIGRSIEKIKFNIGIKKQLLIPLLKNDAIKSNVENSYPEEINNLLAPIDSELSSSTKDLIVQCCKEKGIDYIDASIKYAVKNATKNFDKYLCDTLSKGWAEKDLKKAISAKNKQQKRLIEDREEQEKRQLERQQEQANKSIIENEWHKLQDAEKIHYIKHAEYVMNKHKINLSKLDFIDEILPICVYAVSNEKSYNLAIEGYIHHLLKTSLNINDVI